MCINFTSLNKFCLKDSYPLPLIDKLIDRSTRYERLSFLDAHSGYNQIYTKMMREKLPSYPRLGHFAYQNAFWSKKQQPIAVPMHRHISRVANKVHKSGCKTGRWYTKNLDETRHNLQPTTTPGSNCRESATTAAHDTPISTRYGPTFLNTSTNSHIYTTII